MTEEVQAKVSAARKLLSEHFTCDESCELCSQPFPEKLWEAHFYLLAVGVPFDIPD